MRLRSMPVFERNSIIYLSLIVVSIILAIIFHPLWLLLWPGFLWLDDILYFGFGWSFFDTEIAIQRGYQFANTFLDNQTGEGRDLGFNLYNGDLTKSGKQAQQDKWDFVLSQLNLKAGDRLIDIGCGYGDWLNYARSKGIEVVGVNLSPEQAGVCRERYNLDVIVCNWKEIPQSKELREQLYGQFDAVTFMDSVEHFVPSKIRKDKAKQGKIYSGMFEMAWSLLKEESPSNRVFISCLHMINAPISLWDNLACYLQTRFHSGFYPALDDGLIKWGKEYFNEINRFDQTEDYRLTSVLDDKHFGSPKLIWNAKRMLQAVFLFFLDPHHIHKHLEYKMGAWMWHFGKDAYNDKYDNEHQKQLRHVTLWWLVLEKKIRTSEFVSIPRNDLEVDLNSLK